MLFRVRQLAPTALLSCTLRPPTALPATPRHAHQLSVVRRAKKSVQWKHCLSATTGNGGNGNGIPGGKVVTAEDEGDDGGGVQRTKILTYIYAALILVGGLMGYLKRKSKMSLLSSSVTSAILIGCALGFGTPNDRAAVFIALFGAVSLTAFFFKRYRSSGKPVPGLVGSVLSLCMSVAYATRLL